MKKFIGCDLGGTNVKAAVIDPETGEIVIEKQVPTQAWEGHMAVMVRIAALVDSLLEDSGLPKSEIGGIGIGAPGVLDLEKGETVFLPNLPGTWPHVPLGPTVSELTGLPVHLLNDVRAITFGEWKFGAGRGASTIAVFAIGTGIGGGLVINNRLHLGMGGAAGELGHTMIDFNGPQCGCGSRGCLETFASGPAIAALGMKAVAQGWTTQITGLVEHDLNRITPKVIYRAALEGDRVAQEIYEQVGFYIGIAVANVMASLNPERVVIAGGVSQAGELLLAPIRRTARERVFIMDKDRVEIVQALLGNNAGPVGTALWAHEQMQPQNG
jgi:glucokinase